jgi:hypothetical protein
MNSSNGIGPKRLARSRTRSATDGGASAIRAY